MLRPPSFIAKKEGKEGEGRKEARMDERKNEQTKERKT
jgi:hypothetical protein